MRAYRATLERENPLVRFSALIGTWGLIGTWALRRQRLAATAALLAFVITAAAPAGDPTAVPCSADTPAALPRLHATVTGARKVQGNITFTLYGPRPTAFLAHKGSIALTRVTLTSRSATACFAVSAPGVYALAVYHDQNDNHHFDRTLIGLPAEGYGFSNNAPLRLGPPSFDAAKFPVHAGDNQLAIQLAY